MLGKNIGGKIMTYGKAGCLKVKLFSEAGTGYFYTWKKNPKAYPWRIGALSEFTVKLCSNQFDFCHQPNWQSKAALSRTGHTPSQPGNACPGRNQLSFAHTTASPHTTDQFLIFFLF